eukprot:6205021-Pleurochrysis_carterae.AAC.2
MSTRHVIGPRGEPASPQCIPGSQHGRCCQLDTSSLVAAQEAWIGFQKYFVVHAFCENYTVCDLLRDFAHFLPA